MKKRQLQEQPKQPNDRETQLDNQLKQALADYQNLKRDMEKRLQFEGDIVRADILRSVIGIADDVDVALDHAADDKGWREGITNVLAKFRTVIESMGASMVECKPGDQFDAHVHEAIGVVYEGKEGTIAKVIQNGYKLGDMVVRPARVIVNKSNNINK